MSKGKVDYETLFYDMQRKVREYSQAIKYIGFAEVEYEALNHNPQTWDELLQAVFNIIDTGKELNQIIEQSPSSIYVADVNAKTLRINERFEELTGIKRETLMGRNTQDIEEENIFAPSVCALALREGRRIVVRQTIDGEKEFVTAGTPIINEKGEIYRVITNALLNEEILNMSSYVSNMKEERKKTAIPDKLIATSKQMQNILCLVDLIKNTESTILIKGETGVGKSLLARHIHNSSNRSNNNMTEINCGAIPPALLESELFGYVNGAFTGADKKGKPGLIEISEGGTILLDEISELPLLLQVKLLHFLQDKKITRVGGTKERPVDVRVIAASNTPLEELVEKGEFREDLYYRLNVVPIIIPPLRERKEDIMPAVEYFIEKYTKLYNKTFFLDQNLEKYLYSNTWRGNLRELENCVERLVVTEGTVELAEETGIIMGRKLNPSNQKGIEITDAQAVSKTMNDVEEEMIKEAYKNYKSSYKVAQALGISQSSAYRKIKKYVK